MKKFALFFFVLTLLSCKDDTVALKQNAKKEAQKKERIFNQINDAWFFAEEEFSPEVHKKVIGWYEWRLFVNEINQKPQSSIQAFQKKAGVLVKKALELNKNIPSVYNVPSVKSRITVLVSKLKSLDLYINLNQIPVQNVVDLITEINIDISSLQFQLENIEQRNSLPKEEGEDFIRMKDTSRAIKN